jgi:hypothetical protein
VLTWVGNAAASLFGRHGAVTAQAHQAGCSRQTVYDHATKVQAVVADAQLPGPCRDQLLQEVRRLRDENRQLWQALENTFDCPKAKRRQFAVTAAAMGLSLQQTLVLLAALLPKSLLPSRPTLGRWVQSEAKHASRLLRVLDAVCRPLVLCLCLDEIFFRRQPVLMAIEPHSMAWVLGVRAPDRSGPTWCQALAAWPQVQDVAADGGSGLALGLQLARVTRQEKAAQRGAPAVALHARLDVFHIRQAGARALRLEWQRAENCWEAAEQLERDKRRSARRCADVRPFTFRLLEAWHKAERALAEADRKEQAWGRAVAALAVWRADGQLNERAAAAQAIAAAAAELTGAHWGKARRLLCDERALVFLDRLHEELAQAEPDTVRRAALVALWRWRQQAGPGGTEVAASAASLGRAWVEAVLRDRLGPGGSEGAERVRRVLGRVLRASSAVECVNSVVRMHQARHRQLTQELLDLKRLYWNCRRFVWGKRRKRCPYEHLGLELPSYDPWELLQIGPEKLSQELSSRRVTA